ncbi:MAG: glycosyltransferase family 2 protein [Phycisphaerae bacterium]|nr:glycosyltransferase family 2 protein [Phycisphaerae bacterium]
MTEPAETWPPVSVIIATRNEAPFIERNVRSVLANDYPADKIEVLVVDGMSEDGTADIVRSLREEDSRVRLVENPRRIAPVAFNLGIENSTGEVLFFVSGHGAVSENFLRKSIETFRAQPEAWCVGGAIETINENFIGRAISGAMSSPVGVGNARFRLGNFKGWVDTVTAAGYWRWVFDKIGMFDEELVRHQDDELNLRLILNGGKIYMDSDIKSYYYSRGSLRKLIKQYWQYGIWRPRTIQKHNRPATLRQIAPMIFALIWVVLVAGTLIWHPIGWALGAFAAMYVLGLLAGGLDVARRAGLACGLLAPIVFMILHFCYGFGGLVGIVIFWVLRRGGKMKVEQVSISR